MKLAIALIFATYSVTATDLRITIYNQADLKPEVVDAASDFLKRIFRQSRISVELRLGDANSLEGRLLTYPNPPQPGQEHRVSCDARRDIALQIRDSSSPGVRFNILGLAQPLANRGLNVMMFDDRIRNAALRFNVAYPALLAHAIAHEIGHVMLRSNEHSKSGLMSSSWGGHEYRRLSLGGLLFNHDESAKILGALQGKGCLTGAGL